MNQLKNARDVHHARVVLEQVIKGEKELISVGNLSYRLEGLDIPPVRFAEILDILIRMRVVERKTYSSRILTTEHAELFLLALKAKEKEGPWLP